MIDELEIVYRAMHHGWTNQELADLIIAWRRKHHFSFIDNESHYKTVFKVARRLLDLPAPAEADLAFVYLVEAVGSGRLKIGRARNPERRLRHLQTGSPFPLRLVLVIPGPAELERKLHARFANLRKVGEWFELGDDLVDAIDFAKKQAFRIVDDVFLHYEGDA